MSWRLSLNILHHYWYQVGVEHLLRDINDPTTGTLALQIKQKVNGLTGLLSRLTEIHSYLDKVISGKMPINNQITYNLQNIFNLLPNLNVEELVKSLFVKTNDMHLVMYVASLVRSIVALHGLLANKIKYRDIDAILDDQAGIKPAASADAGGGDVKPKPHSKPLRDEKDEAGESSPGGKAGPQGK